jgi:hypothetical protein
MLIPSSHLSVQFFLDLQDCIKNVPANSYKTVLLVVLVYISM